MEFNKAEVINCISSDMVYSNYPDVFGKHWSGVYNEMDKFGRVDRRRKNDDDEKRAHILEGRICKEENRELVVTGTGY